MAQNLLQMYRVRYDTEHENIQRFQQTSILRSVSIKPNKNKKKYHKQVSRFYLWLRTLSTPVGLDVAIYGLVQVGTLYFAYDREFLFV